MINYAQAEAVKLTLKKVDSKNIIKKDLRTNVFDATTETLCL